MDPSSYFIQNNWHIDKIFTLVLFDQTEKLLVPTLTEMGDNVIYEHEDVYFETNASGKPEPTVEWFHGFNKLRRGEGVQIEKSGDLHSLLLKDCTTDQSGTVTAVASNKAGTCTVESSLLVKGMWLIPWKA